MKINLSNDQKRTLVWIASLVICFALSAILGIRYPLPVEPVVSGSPQYTEGDTNFTNVVASGDVTAGDDVIVGDTLDLGGDLDLDGDGLDVDVTGAISLDADAASNFNTSAGDITINSEAASVTIKGDEANAAAVFIDANNVATSGLDIDVGSVSGMTIDGGLLDVGGGTGGTADGDNDLLVAGDLEVDTNTVLDGDLTVDGTANLDDVDVDLSAEMNIDGELVCIGATGDGGTADGDDDLIVKGDLEVDDTLDVDGDIDLDGDGFDVAVSAAFSIDGGASSNITLSTGDITVEAATGSVIIKGDEAVADAVFIDANDVATTGLDIDVGSVSGMTIDGGLLDVGGGSYATVNGDNDLGVAGDLEVDGTTDLDGALSIEGDLTMQNDETLSNAVDGTITATVAAGGYFAVTTGNLVVGEPTLASLTLNGNDAYVQGNLEADGTVRLDGELDVAVGPYVQTNGLWIPSTDDYTWNDSDVFTPTIHSYNIDTGGNVTVTLAACAYDGQPLFLAFDDANNVIINYTNVRTPSGAALTVDQYDTLAFVCMDTEWLLLLESNNQ